MKLIFDFDDVLLNTKGLKYIMCEKLREEGVDNGEELYEIERQKGKAFTLKEFLKNVCLVTEAKGFPPIKTDVLYEKIMEACPGLINHELVDVIKATGKENCFIVSNGDQEFQEDKITRTGLDALVTRVVIVPGTKSIEIQKICNEFPEDKVIFIDDKSIYFNDIDQEAATNLKMILYTGKETVSEIEKEIGVRELQEP
jgi:FMN phosphatase YigB (HAD superfamily)